MGASLILKFCFSNAQLCLKKNKLKQTKIKMLHACALVGWYTFVYQPTPPILIFSSSANIMNNTETNSLAKLSKI